METTVMDPVERVSLRGMVKVHARFFGCDALNAFHDQRVLVTWDESDQGQQVWVADMEGNLIGAANALDSVVSGGFAEPPPAACERSQPCDSTAFSKQQRDYI